MTMKALTTFSLPAVWTLTKQPLTGTNKLALSIPINRTYNPKRLADTRTVTVRKHTLQ